MAKQAHLQAILSAVDRLSPTLNKIGANTVKTKVLMNSLNAVNFRRLSGSFKVISKSLTDVTTATQDVAGKLLSLVGLGALSFAGLGVGFLSASRGAMQFSAGLQDASELTGESVNSLQLLQGAFRMGGVEAEAATEAIVKFNRGMAEAAAGKDKSFAALMTRLRIPLRDARGQIRSLSDVLPELSDAFEKNTNPAIRTRIAMEIFGKSGSKLIGTLSQGGESLQELFRNLESSGRVLSTGAIGRLDKLDENLEELGVRYRVLSGEILSRAAPAVQRLVERMQDWISSNREVIAQRIGAVIERVANSFAAWVESGGFERLTTEIRRAWTVLGEFVQRLGGLGGVAKLIGVLLLAGPVAALVNLAGAVGRLALVALPLLGRAMLIVGRIFLLNPIGLVLTAIAAAAYLIYRNWSTVGPFFAQVWDNIKTAAMTAWNVLRFVFSWSPLGIVVNNWGAISSFLGDLWTSISGAVVDGLATVGRLLAEWTPLRWVRQAWEPVLEFLGGVWDRVSEILGPVLRLVGAGANAVRGALGSVGTLAQQQFGPDSQLEYGPRFAAQSPTPLMAAGALQSTARVQGDMRVRFENAPPGMRVDPGTTTSPGLAFNPDVGYRSMGGLG